MSHTLSRSNRGLTPPPLGHAAPVPSPGPSAAPSPRSSARGTPRPSPSSSARATLPAPPSPRPPSSRSSRASTGQLMDKRKSNSQGRREQGTSQEPPVANRWFSPRARRSLNATQAQGDSKDQRGRTSSARRELCAPQQGESFCQPSRRSTLRSKDARIGEAPDNMVQVGQVVYLPISSGEVPRHQQPDEILNGMAALGGRTSSVDSTRSADNQDNVVLNELADATDVMKSVLANMSVARPSVPTPFRGMPMVPSITPPSRPLSPPRTTVPSEYETRRTEERLSLVERQLDEARQMLSIVTDEMSRTTISLCKVHADSLRRDLQTELCDIVDERVHSLMMHLEGASKENDVDSAAAMVWNGVHANVSSQSSSREEHEHAKNAVDELLVKLGALDACISEDNPAVGVPDLAALHNLVKTTAVDVKRLRGQQEGDAHVEKSEDFLQETIQAGGARIETSDGFLQETRQAGSPGAVDSADEEQVQYVLNQQVGVAVQEQPLEKRAQYRELLKAVQQDIFTKSKVCSLPSATNGRSEGASPCPRSDSVMSSPSPSAIEGADWKLLEASPSTSSSACVPSSWVGYDENEEAPLPVEAIWPPKSKLDLSFFLPSTDELRSSMQPMSTTTALPSEQSLLWPSLGGLGLGELGTVEQRAGSSRELLSFGL